MGHNNNINAIINFLEDQDRSYQLAKKDSDRDRIQNTTRIWMMLMIISILSYQAAQLLVFLEWDIPSIRIWQ